MKFFNNLDLKQNQLLNARAHSGDAPANPQEGMFYYDTGDNNFWVYTDDGWKSALYVLEKASETKLGGIKAASIAANEIASYGVEVKINGEKLYVPNYPTDYVKKNTSIAAATKTKITYDSKGLVTAGADLTAEDIPDLAQSQITNLSIDLGKKVDKETGKGLSENDFTDEYKDKLDDAEVTSNKVSSWSSAVNHTRYPSEKLVKDNLDAINVGLENIVNLSPLRFAGYFTGGTVSNDFNNLIRPFENLTNPLSPDFYLDKIKGAMFVCNAASDFVFNTVYFWSAAEGTGKTTPITFNWAAPYDQGIGTIGVEVGDTISILNFAYDAVENEMFILVKVEKSSGLKADKVISATAGNIPKLNASGNLEDSGFTLGKSVPSNAVFTDTVYTLQKATASTLGGIKAKAKESTDTVEVKIDTDGRLYVPAPDAIPAETDPIFTVWDRSTGISIVKSQVSDFAHTHVKADITDFAHTHVKADITDFAHDHDVRYYTKEDADTLLNTKLNTSLKGSNNGLAELGSDGKVPSSQLPSYVDDVLEYISSSSFPSTGESGKIYISKDTNKTYRWGGSGYVEISSSLALGQTDSTAGRGDWTKTAYDHTSLTDNPHEVTAAQTGAEPAFSKKTAFNKNFGTTSDTVARGNHLHAGVYEAANSNIQSHISSTDNPHNVTQAQVGLGNVNNTSDVNKPISTATQTALNKKTGKYSDDITLSQGVVTPVVHNLGTKDVIVSLRDSNDEIVYCDIEVFSVNQIKIWPANIGTETSFRVTVIG